MNVPTTPHYAIVTERTIYHEGDERSRTNPGHGYPAYTETVTDYKAFTDRESWEREIKMHEKDSYKPKYVAMYVTPARVATSVSVDVSVKL